MLGLSSPHPAASTVALAWSDVLSRRRSESALEIPLQELCNGGSLAALLASGRLTSGSQPRATGAQLSSLTIRLSILHHVAGGLAALHAAGIVHGDLKPQNVLLQVLGIQDEPLLSVDQVMGALLSGRSVLWKISDHGLCPELQPAELDAGPPLCSAARFALLLRPVPSSRRRTLATSSNDLLASRHADARFFQAPETLTGSAVSCASDVYAFGVLMWSLLAHGARAPAAPRAAHALERSPRSPLAGGGQTVLGRFIEGVPVKLQLLALRCLEPVGARPCARHIRDQLHAAVLARLQV